MFMFTVRRAGWLLLCMPTIAAAEGRAIDSARAVKDDKDDVLWYDARLLPIEGQGWTDTEAPYDRLPARAKGKVRDAVWSLSRDSSGIAVRFVTDATTMHARWTLNDAGLAMNHMPATGVSGVDLYVQDAGRWRWLACGRPDAQTNTKVLVSGLPAGQRSYMLYLPLYNGVSSVEIGIPAGSHLSSAAPRPEAARKPIVFYGTSITQGGCASRPGMAYPAIVGRKLDRPVINLGFSGNGPLEPEVVTFIAEIDAAVFVLDCLPNTTGEQVAQRVRPCVKILREAHPETPILLVEDRTYANAYLIGARRERNDENRRELRKAYDEFRAAGDKLIFYMEGEDQIGADSEGTVDGSHPTDLGFMRQAEAFVKALEPILRTR